MPRSACDGTGGLLSADPLGTMSPMTPEEAARLIEGRDEPAFVELWRRLDDDLDDLRFTAAIAETLRAEPDLVDAWTVWSGEQRWSPGAYVEGVEVGWFDGSRQHVRRHADQAAAVADFIRRIARWLSRRDAEYANAES